MPRDMAAEAETEPWRQVLLDAASLIEKRGFAQLLLVDEIGALCLHGAINMAARGNPYSWQTIGSPELAVSRYLRLAGADEFEASELYGCSGWNNAPERTKEEVVAALRGAADMSEAAL